MRIHIRVIAPCTRRPHGRVVIYSNAITNGVEQVKEIYHTRDVEDADHFVLHINEGIEIAKDVYM